MTSAGTARTIAGLLFAPIVPGILIVGALLAIGEREDALAVIQADLVFGVPISILLGVPSHALLVSNRWTSWLAYAATGALLGALLYAGMPLLIEGLMQLQGLDASGHVMFSSTVLPAAMLCTMVAAVSFWLIARPDRATAR